MNERTLELIKLIMEQEEEEKPKQVTIEHPELNKGAIDSIDWSDKTEAMRGLFIDGNDEMLTKITNLPYSDGSIKNVKVATPVDSEKGKVLDMTKEPDRKRLSQIIAARLEGVQPKLLKAIEFIKKEDINIEKNDLLNWLGEIGELYAIKHFLDNSIPVFMLTTNAKTTDMVVLTDCGAFPLATMDQTVSNPIASKVDVLKTKWNKEGYFKSIIFLKQSNKEVDIVQYVKTICTPKKEKPKVEKEK